MKPRLKPSRTVDITRLSAPVGAWVSWSRTAAKISEPVAPANPSSVKLTTNAIHTSVVNAITNHPTRPTTAPSLNNDSRSVSRSDHLPTTKPRTGAARLVRKNKPATGSDASRSCTKNSDSCGMATEIPRPAKNRLPSPAGTAATAAPTRTTTSASSSRVLGHSITVVAPSSWTAPTSADQHAPHDVRGGAPVIEHIGMSALTGDLGGPVALEPKSARMSPSARPSPFGLSYRDGRLLTRRSSCDDTASVGPAPATCRQERHGAASQADALRNGVELHASTGPRSDVEPSARCGSSLSR